MIPVFFALLQAASAAPAPVCTATVAPPAGLEAWKVAPGMTADMIPINKGTSLTLERVDRLTFAPPPARLPKAGTFGGIYHFTVTAAGTYRIALQAGAWIDLVRDGKMVDSVAHTEGAPCSGIRKIVDFTLVPGRYALQLSGATAAAQRVLIAAK